MKNSISFLRIIQLFFLDILLGRGKKGVKHITEDFGGTIECLEDKTLREIRLLKKEKGKFIIMSGKQPYAEIIVRSPYAFCADIYNTKEIAERQLKRLKKKNPKKPFKIENIDNEFIRDYEETRPHY